MPISAIASLNYTIFNSPPTRRCRRARSGTIIQTLLVTGFTRSM
jgi:hypothetical protein